MARPNHILSAFLSACSLTACQPGNGTIKIEIAAKTPDKEPVSGANVTLDNEQIGQTNAFGTFSSTVSVSALRHHRITVTREDSSHYYAPHFETFKVARGGTLNLTIKPVLYVVPKSKTKLSSNPREPSTSRTTQLAANAKPAQEKEVPNTGGSGIPLIILSERDIAGENSQRAESPTSHVMFTAHVYAGRQPLGDASVSFIQANGIEYSCKTNDRGRCAITVQNARMPAGSVLVQRQGFKSILKELTPIENANIRLAMEPGLTIDIKIVANGPWGATPLPGSEIRLRGATVGITNSQGLSVVSPEGPLPVSLRVESPAQGDALDLNIQNAAETKVVAKFSDNLKNGWNQWRVYPLSGKSGALESIPTTSLAAIETSLYRDTQAIREPIELERFSSLPAGSIALLPVTEQSEKRVTLTLYAVDSTGILASSSPAQVKSPLLADAWISACDEAKSSLLSRLPWPGSVKSAKKGMLSLAINGKYVHVNDLVTIASEKGHLTARIISTTGGNIEARLEGTDGTKDESNKLMGAVVRKILPPANQASIEAGFLATLKPIAFDRAEIRLAKKYLAENNPQEALKALSTAEKSGVSNILVRQMKATISQESGEVTAVVHELYDILRLATDGGLTFATLVTEANLIRAQTESLPVITGDIDLIKRYDELAQRAIGITTDLESRFASRLSDSSIAATLNYTRLVATRKGAECAGDEVTLATLGSQWDDFEKSLPADKLQKTDRVTWSRVVSSERSRVSLTSDQDKRSL